MVFSSSVFLGIFLPSVLLLYYIIPNRGWRNTVLLIASLVFYAWGEPIWVFAMIALSLVDYAGGIAISRMEEKARKPMLVVLIALNLAMLFMFKYFNFLIENVEKLFSLFKAGTGLPRFPYAMPIGISFFTFQALTYIVDIYRGEVEAKKNPLHVLLYISLFPQLIAGPIVRYSDVSEEISCRKENITEFASGALRFSIGLAKKVILANYAGSVATSLLTDNLSGLSSDGALIGNLMYTLQIYYDFSGYSDMAIGLGLMFGFHFKENFQYPYISRSITEFWRRWHISLGSFFRDYVYIPLGGNRRHAYLNIFIVWMLTGLWHGASWNFIIWGLYYGILLVIEKSLRKHGIDMGKIPVLSTALVLIFVSFGWAIFYYTDMWQLSAFCSALFSFGSGPVTMGLKELTQVNSIFYLIPIMIIGATPLPAKIGAKIAPAKGYGVVLRILWMAVLLAASYIFIISQTYNPFLYFRF